VFYKNLKTFLLDKPLCIHKEYFNLYTRNEDSGCAYHVLYGIYGTFANFLKMYCHACLYLYHVLYGIYSTTVSSIKLSCMPLQ